MSIICSSPEPMSSRRPMSSPLDCGPRSTLPPLKTARSAPIATSQHRNADSRAAVTARLHPRLPPSRVVASSPGPCEVGEATRARPRTRSWRSARRAPPRSPTPPGCSRERQARRGPGGHKTSLRPGERCNALDGQDLLLGHVYRAGGRLLHGLQHLRSHRGTTHAGGASRCIQPAGHAQGTQEACHRVLAQGVMNCVDGLSSGIRCAARMG